MGRREEGRRKGGREKGGREGEGREEGREGEDVCVCEGGSTVVRQDD